MGIMIEILEMNEKEAKVNIEQKKFSMDIFSIKNSL